MNDSAAAAKRTPSGIFARPESARADSGFAPIGTSLMSRLRDAADGLELGLEQGLVDLAVVDRDALLDAEPDDRLAVDTELLRELLGRQVVRHAGVLLQASKKPAGAARTVGLSDALSTLAGGNGPASQK